MPDNFVNILRLVKTEPEWAATRIQEGEKAIERLREVRVKSNIGDVVSLKATQEFLLGYLAALQFVIISHGMDSIAEEAMRESGYTENGFLKAQKQTGYESRKMNKIIRNAFFIDNDRS